MSILCHRQSKPCFLYLLCFCFFDKEQRDAFFLWSFVSSVIPHLYKNMPLYNNGTPSVVTASAEKQVTAEFFQVILLLLCPTKQSKQFSQQTVLQK